MNRTSALCQKQTFDVPEADYFSLTVALWGSGTDALSRAAVPLSTLERLYLLVDQLIRADRCAGTMPLTKLLQMHIGCDGQCL